MMGAMFFLNEIATIGIYGFLKNFCPDGFYLSNILSSPSKNFTVNQSTQDVLPVLVYSNLFLTLIALLITDVLQYKTLIVTGALASVASKSLLFWSNSVMHMQVMQFLFGVYKASQVAYRTYIYTKVKKHNYQRVTAIVHIAPKMGTLTSAIVAQLLLSSRIANLDVLMEISLIALSMALIMAILLPPVEGTVFSEDSSSTLQQKSSVVERYRKAACILWQEFTNAITNPRILHWCVWWVLATAGAQLTTDYYVQALWNDISKQQQPIYNAGVDAIYACLSSLACFLTAKLTVDWKVCGNTVFALCTLTKGVALIYSAYTNCIFVAYSLYIGISTLYDAMMVICNSQVALLVKNDSFGLIFGINTFLALIVQSGLTYVLTSKSALALPIRHQFEVVGCFIILLGIGYLLKAVHSTYPELKKKNINEADIENKNVIQISISQ